MDAYEKSVVLRTLQQVQNETDKTISELKKTIKK